MIEVQNIQKSFGAHEVLKGIDAQFEQGKTNLIIGQSGSGKTVFLNCLVVCMSPTMAPSFSMTGIPPGWTKKNGNCFVRRWNGLSGKRLVRQPDR